MFACIHVPNFSNEAHAALLDCAGVFSPRVENTAPGTVVFDLEGLERLFGSYSEIAEKVAAHVRAAGIQAHVAVASNPDAAITAARGFRGVTVLGRGTEEKRLEDLSLDVLSPSPEILETLDRWGIRTIRGFAQLPAVQVSERLGQEGIRLHKLARGAGSRPLVPHQEALRFIEVMELDYEIGAIEPLTFILSRLLDQICSRLRTRNLATHEIHLALGMDARVLHLPVPVCNPKLLTKLLILDLEAHPPGASIHQVKVEAIPAKPRIVQNGLFIPLSPEPEKLELTLARIAAVVGKENVGSPEVLDTYRPDAFRVKKFGVMSAGSSEIAAKRRQNVAQGVSPGAWLLGISSPGRAAEQISRSAAPAGAGPEKITLSQGLHPGLRSGAAPRLNFVHRLTLRRFRPCFEATVQLRNSVPIWIAFHGVHGSVEKASGPWRSSGDWWRPNNWDREEWDIEVLDGGLYRIYYDVHTDRWFAEGVYD